MEKILLCFKAFCLGTTLYTLIFSSKWIELLLSYLLVSHAYKEGKKYRNISREPWLSRNKGHKEECLRYRQLSKLSSAFACAAVFALCFLNLWITLYNRKKRVKTGFLQQRTQAVFLKDYPSLVGKWNSRNHTWSTHEATSHMRLFWQTSPHKKHSSGIHLFPQHLLFLSRYHKRQANATQEPSQLTFCIDCSRTCLNTAGQKATFNRLLTAWCSRIIKTPLI